MCSRLIRAFCTGEIEWSILDPAVGLERAKGVIIFLATPIFHKSHHRLLQQATTKHHVYHIKIHNLNEFIIS